MSDSKEIFLVDSNSFMTPFRLYYAFDLVPAYWAAISKYVSTGQIVVLDKVKAEIDKGEDELTNWFKSAEDLQVIPSITLEVVTKYQEVLQYVQTCGLYLESAVHTWVQNNVADPWLIAAACSNDFVLVTEEKRSNGLSKKTPNKGAKIPNVADHFNVRTIDIFEMMRRLNIVIK